MPGPDGREAVPQRLRGAHTRHRLLYHLVWIPKYRKKILAGGVAARLRGLIERTARQNAWPLIELNIQSDHVHALLQLDPSTSVSRAMQLLKGSSSIRLREEFPVVRRAIWGKSLWADGYYAATVGTTQEAVIRRYIREQPEKDQSLS
jgi:putative transposase